MKVYGVAERAVKRMTCALQSASSAWLSAFLFFYLGRVRWETAPNKLDDEENETVLCLQNRNRLRVVLAFALAVAGIRECCSSYAGFQPW